MVIYRLLSAELCRVRVAVPDTGQSRLKLFHRSAIARRLEQKILEGAVQAVISTEYVHPNTHIQAVLR